jgi:hypothetical protein
VFCIWYRLYEWMMTSFSLVNVFWASFKDILTSLTELLNKFCSVYEWYSYFHQWIAASTSKSCTKILLQLWEVDLQIDIDKCEFKVKSIKYLKFILKVKKGVQMNSQRWKFMNWQVSKSVKECTEFHRLCKLLLKVY